MSDFVVVALLIVCCAWVCFLLGVVFGCNREEVAWQRKLIARGHARYHPTTGAWEWNADAARRERGEGRRVMSFTDQKRRVASEAEISRSWAMEKNGTRFRCYLCGHQFAPGDGWRWVYTGGKNFTTKDGKAFSVMNFLTCDSCDGPDVIDRWGALNGEFHSSKFWALR